MKKCLFFIFLVLFSYGVYAQKTPTYAQYASKVEKAKATKINFSSNKDARMFRTNLTNALKKGVNFAGHYAVSTWGCGTNCSQTGIVDARNGNVYFPKELAGAGFGFCDMEADEAVVYRRDSRLLILNGFKGGDLEKENSPCGIYYFEWTGTALKQVKFVQKKRTDTP